jgi:hypothetical protein
MTDESFGRAYAAVLYLAGERGESLRAMAEGIAPAATLRALVEADRPARVVVLARETAQIALAASAMSYPSTRPIRSTGLSWR